MNREEARKFSYECGNGDDSTVDAIYDDIENRLCKNCKWYLDEVCVNDESPLCTDFVSETYGCVYFERKINEIG